MSDMNGTSQEKSLDIIREKDKFDNKFINIIKKKWLISGSKTFLLVAILVAIFILITYGMQKLELTPIDLTSNKAYTMSDESKEKISKIDKDVNVYLIGFTDDDSVTVIAKQYNKVNSKINVEAVDITQRKDLADKYKIDKSSANGIIVESGEKSKVLTTNDLVNYDSETYETTDVSEEKLTSAIMNISTENIPNIYFLSNYSDISLESGLSYLQIYLQNEIVNTQTVDILSKGSVPDDCSTLVILTPDKDFEDIVADSIIKYINNGGNILWFNFAYGTEKNLPNVNKVLAAYGVNPFSVGYIMETDTSKMIAGAPYMILPDVQSSKVTEKSKSVLMIQPTKINIVESEKLNELKVEKEDLLVTSEASFFRSDIKMQATSKTDTDESGKFIVGTKLTKSLDNDKKSTLILYGDNYMISDMPISQNSSSPIVAAYNNKDLALNSLAYLTEREENITVRKTKDNVATYNATELEIRIIQIIIFAVPAIIIIAGIVVWQVRRRKK